MVYFDEYDGQQGSELSNQVAEDLSMARLVREARNLSLGTRLLTALALKVGGWAVATDGDARKPAVCRVGWPVDHR